MLGNSVARTKRAGEPGNETNPAARLSPAAAESFVHRLSKWFLAHARDLPWRRTTDPYAIWVSEIMLQQTQVKTVIPYFERWMQELPAVEALAHVPADRLHKLWEGLGYYTRVRNMQRAAHVVLREHGGLFPRCREQVLELPGIGPYTAGAICSIAFNQPTPILDGNVIRVLSRVYGVRGDVREKAVNGRLWGLANELVISAGRAGGCELQHASGDTRIESVSADQQVTLLRLTDSGSGERRASRVTSTRQHGRMVFAGSCSVLNQGLMELGATVCTPRDPRCPECPLAEQCIARREKLVEVLPELGERVAATARRYVAAIVERDGKVLVRQRPAGVVNGHLWEFPNVEVPLRASASKVKAELERELGCLLHGRKQVGTVKHTITRYRISLEVIRAELNGSMPAPKAGAWRAVDCLSEIAFTSAHRQVADRWLSSGGNP